jgi:hypothetical protein
MFGVADQNLSQPLLLYCKIHYFFQAVVNPIVHIRAVSSILRMVGVYSLMKGLIVLQ